MDGEDYIALFGIIGLILLILFVVAIELIAVILVAGAIASWLGLSGILWWAVAIGLFLIINGIIGALMRR